MATLVLTTVGTALGGPIGGVLGSLVGQSIDRGLFGNSLRKSPRLGDFSLQTSSYGSPIPRIYGTMRVAGTVIWATDLRQEEVIEGGGKSGPEQARYNYSASLAVALSSRPIGAVKRIWADGKLIRGAAGDFKVRTRFRVALGGEDQPIDPLIASIESIEGTPAYRGLALAIFEDLELAEFGNRIPVLTFEVAADDGPLSLAALLSDASGGLIAASDTPPVAGFAAHGTSIGDSLAQLVEIYGLYLADRDGKLRTAPAATPLLIAGDELGCDADGRVRPKIERTRSPEAALPAAITMTFYDAGRNYQAGQMRAASGSGGSSDQPIELPAVLSAGEAKQLVEANLARRWQEAEKIRLQLPPSHFKLRPGDAIQLEGSSSAWVIRRASIEGMAISIEAIAAPATIEPLPADPGRPVSEQDELVGRSELALFELPTDSDAPDQSPRAMAAISSNGLWRGVPVELSLGASPLPAVVVGRRAVLGKAETVIQARCPPLMDELSQVTVRLANERQILLNADWDGLMAGANLAQLGEEMLQFGRADQLGVGLYRLSRFLRGRRATEWAAGSHLPGEPFCLIDPLTMVPINLGSEAVGGNLKAVTHGLADVAPLPEARRMISGEAMRPPSPCHFKAMRSGGGVTLSWVRRSFRNWAWADAIGDSVDGFPELYRLTIQGPAQQATFETAGRSITLGPAQIPAEPGQLIAASVVTVGPAALSRSATITLTF